MKQLFLIAAIFCLVACGNKSAEPPANLLTEQQMENILYDMAVLQTMSSVTPQPIQENGIDVKNYIYKKYSIDSLTLVQNQKYYAGDIAKYQEIHKKVVERIKLQKAPLDSIRSNANKERLNKLKAAPATPTVQ